MDKSKEKYPGRFYISLDLDNEIEDRVAKRLSALPWGFKTQYVVSAITFYLENGEPGFFEDIQKLFTAIDTPTTKKRVNSIKPTKPKKDSQPNQKPKPSSPKKLQKRHADQPRVVAKQRMPVQHEADPSEIERRKKLKKALSQFEF